MAAFTYSGWVELDGRKLAPAEIEKICTTIPNEAKKFGGEFFLSFDSCHARDHFGIMPGPGPKGALVCNDKTITTNRSGPGALHARRSDRDLP